MGRDTLLPPRARPQVAFSSYELAEPEVTQTSAFKQLLPEQTGVEFVNVIDTTHPRKYLYFSGTSGGGIAIGDVDADGRPDLYFVNGPGENRLYRQVERMRFEDVTDQAGVAGGDAWGTGATMADVNNDGWLDIYVCNYDSPNLLFINRGDGTFLEQGVLYGVDVVDASMMATFADYDRDGDLDFHLLTYRYMRPEGRPADPPIIEVEGERQIAPGFEKYYTIDNEAPGFAPVARADGLFRNEGERFTDVTEEAGIVGLWHGLSATWWDYNRDGWPDLYVANDFADPDQFYHNNGDGTFREISRESIPSTSWFSMGADSGDVNNDGLPDLLVADMSATTHFKQKVMMGEMGQNQKLLETEPRQYMRNTLLVNTGTERFMELAFMAGLDSTDWTWTVKLADLDNDGWLDAYFTNGSPRNFIDADIPFSPQMLIGRTNWDLYEDSPPLKEANLAYRNRGDFAFDDASEAWGLNHVGISLAAAHADLDRDGDLDLVVANFDEPVSIYRNDASQGNGVLIQLEGVSSNRFGLGARLTAETSGGAQVRYHNPTGGFLSSNEPLVHFGLGGSDEVTRLTIDWPSGHRQSFANLPVDRFYTITEPVGQRKEGEKGRMGEGETDQGGAHASLPFSPSPPLPVSARPKGDVGPLFERSDALANAVHREHPFDDYQRQPLLPCKHSQLGPGLAWGDFDGDGRDDLYVGGGAGEPGQLWISDENGAFRRQDIQAFKDDAAHEDMGAVWLDVDADGDLDLYVVSGGVEFEPGDQRLADRLYVNDGRGQLSRAKHALPDLRSSGGPVVAADFDRDGDVDLFVGGRVIPGQYPLAPESFLLTNEQGNFVDATEQVAPGLKEAGMVTSALWSDADADGWLDLLVTYEWGPIRYYWNNKGALVDHTTAAGLDDRTGWWQGIAGGDFDHDGDVDYVVTNFGLNTKYHATVDKPALLYYGDFDGSGRMQLVEAEFEDETLFPVRGKSCSTKAMPFLAERFSTFRSFAAASLVDIYTPTCLDNAHRFAANTLESGLLRNQGNSMFRFETLPRLAQAAPGFGAIVRDLDLDGNQDIYFVQNFYSPQPETGRMAGGLSLLLRGDGNGDFEPVWPRESGLVVPGDAKSLTAADINQDGLTDLVVGVNDGPVETFVRRGPTTTKTLTLRLIDSHGAPSAPGARMVVRFTSGAARTFETYAGGGYLSQSSPSQVVALPNGDAIDAVEVTWPDGTKSTHKNEGWNAVVQLRQD
jgi:hypothetical protein